MTAHTARGKMMARQRLKTEDDIFFEEEKKDSIGDAYDLFDLGTQIHSKNTLMSRDFMLSDLNDKERKFIREQLLVAKALKEYLQDPIAAEQAQQMILEDIINVINLSRARNGRMIKALVDFFKQEGQKEEPKKSLLQQIFGREKEEDV